MTFNNIIQPTVGADLSALSMASHFPNTKHNITANLEKTYVKKQSFSRRAICVV